MRRLTIGTTSSAVGRSSLALQSCTACPPKSPPGKQNNNDELLSCSEARFRNQKRKKSERRIRFPPLLCWETSSAAHEQQHCL